MSRTLFCWDDGRRRRTDLAAFKLQTRRAFERLGRTLAVAGCNFAYVPKR